VIAKLDSTASASLDSEPKSPLLKEPESSQEDVGSYWHKVDEVKEPFCGPLSREDSEVRKS
jgi:hypothetical protein